MKFTTSTAIVAASLVYSALAHAEEFAFPVPEPGSLSPASKTLDAVKNGKWESLFDGTSLKGWVGDGYEVADGAITCTPKGQFLHTEKAYGDFVLQLEFKLKPGSNNGVGLRYPGKGDGAYEGMEIQVLDDNHPKYAGLQTWQFTGSVYNTQASTQSKKDMLKPVGEWNQETIVCIGDHVKVILNGETITDCFLNDIQFDRAKHPGAARKDGFIAFCGHGDYVAYRNLQLMDFSAGKPLLEGNAENTAPAGFSPIFNGKDLTGWNCMVAGGNPYKRREMTPEALLAAQTEANANGFKHWTAEGGEVRYSGKGKCNLCTAKPYGDFEIYVDWKIPATADSGLYLRSTPQVQIWDPTNPTQFQHGNQKGSGGLWNNKAKGLAGKDPLVKADKALGEWNSFHIRMIGQRVTIHLNGQLVIDNQIMENYWNAKEPILREELFELQDHGNNLAFKNIYLRELPW
jgi:hypothetical protein